MTWERLLAAGYVKRQLAGSETEIFALTHAGRDQLTPGAAPPQATKCSGYNKVIGEERQAETGEDRDEARKRL